MIYVPAAVMPASILAKLKRQRKRKCQCKTKTKTKMILNTKQYLGDGGIASELQQAVAVVSVSEPWLCVMTACVSCIACRQRDMRLIHAFVPVVTTNCACTGCAVQAPTGLSFIACTLLSGHSSLHYQTPCNRRTPPYWAFTRYDRRTDWSARPRLRPTGRSDQSDRPVGQTVAEPPTSINHINVAFLATT